MIKLPLIDIKDVFYAYPIGSTRESRSVREGQRVVALRGVSLQIYEGEHVALLGHNGSGKSTLARLCNGLLVPDKGQVVVEGDDTRDERCWRAIREQVGIIFQNPDNQIIATTVEDDVAWGLSRRGFPRAVIQERVEVALEAVGIAHLRSQSPQYLSGGQRQRLAIASLLALRPCCIIADEATSMLDPFARCEITELLAGLNQSFGITVIQVTHLLEEIVAVQRVVVLAGGMIVVQGRPADVFADLALLQELKLHIPEPLLLAARLRAKGIALSQEAISLEVIAEELGR
jgi:energy-coupling factor transport system ATP-binding protein